MTARDPAGETRFFFASRSTDLAKEGLLVVWGVFHSSYFPNTDKLFFFETVLDREQSEKVSKKFIGNSFPVELP